MEKVWPIMRDLGIRSLLIVPLIIQDRVIGSFSLDLKTTQRHFTPSEIEMTQTIASQLAVAIENARWLEKEHKRLKEELETARQIQTSLLPMKVPEVPGLDITGFSYPARRVGGDLYNYFVFDQEHIGIAIGDVSGKGMQAALMMALSVGLVTTNVRKNMSPADLLTTLNTELEPHMQRNWMNTALSYLTLKHRHTTRPGWELCVANAGLVAPLVRRSSGALEWLDVRGLPLGMTDDIEYGELHDTLDPGDILLLSSDGVIEATNAQGEMYGVDRLLTCVAKISEHSAQAILNLVLKDVQTFVGDSEATDDLTMVVVVVQSDLQH
jgi:sigma-B regulation protein RsbU (phosphoserine phosphatase)